MGIREILLIITITGICGWALVRPQIGLYGYLWFATMQPDVFAWCEGKWPFSMALALATLAGSCRHIQNFPRIFTNPFSRMLVLMQIPIGLSILFSYGPFLAEIRYRTYISMIVMVLLIPMIIETQDQLRILLLVLALSLGVLGAKFGFYGLAHGGALFNGQVGQQYDNNTLAQALAMSLPLGWFSRSLWKQKWIKFTLLGMVALTPAAIIMTSSRSASVGAAAAVLLFLYRSRKNRLTVAIVFALAVGPAVYMVRAQYLERMETIANYKEEASAASRVVLAKAGLRLWADHPFFGVGFGSRNYVAAIPPYLPPGQPEHLAVLGAHNTYVQMIADSGVFTLLIFVGLLLRSIFMLGRSISHPIPGHSDLAGIPMALQLSLVVYLIGAGFHSLDRYDLVYILLMCSSAWYSISQRLQLEAESAREEHNSTEEPVEVSF